MDRYSRDSRAYDQHRNYSDRSRSDTYRPGESYRPVRDDRDDRDDWDDLRAHPHNSYSLTGQSIRSDPSSKESRYNYQESRGYYKNHHTRSNSRSRSRSPRRPSYSDYSYRGPPSSRRSPSTGRGRRDSDENYRRSYNNDSDYFSSHSRNVNTAGSSGSYKSPSRRHYTDSPMTSPSIYHTNREQLAAASQARHSTFAEPNIGSSNSSRSEVSSNPQRPLGAQTHSSTSSVTHGRLQLGSTPPTRSPMEPSVRGRSHNSYPAPMTSFSNVTQRQRPSWATEQEREIEQYDVMLQKFRKEEGQILASVRKAKLELAWAEWETMKGEHQLELVQKQWEENEMASVLEETA